jgi:transcriptional regulator with XRE-family HTH domain
MTTYATLDELANYVKSEMDCTQKEMARALDVSQPVVSDALKGRSSQRRTLFRIAGEVGLAVDKTCRYKVRLSK